MRYWYINLERRPDRDAKQREHLRTHGYPDAIVRRIEAKDREAYSSPMILAAAAADDGFPQFQELPIIGHHIEFWGLNWTYMAALREIQKQPEKVILALDDWGTSVDYAGFQEILEEIPDFDIAQVAWNVHDPYQSLCEEASEHWRHGIASTGQDITVFSPLGASVLLDACEKHPENAAEVTLKILALHSPDIRIYCFKDPASMIVGLDSEQNDNMVDICYQGNYHRNGVRVSQTITDSKPKRIKSFRHRIQERS